MQYHSWFGSIFNFLTFITHCVMCLVIGNILIVCLNLRNDKEFKEINFSQKAVLMFAITAGPCLYWYFRVGKLKTWKQVVTRFILAFVGDVILKYFTLMMTEGFTTKQVWPNFFFLHNFIILRKTQFVEIKSVKMLTFFQKHFWHISSVLTF